MENNIPKQSVALVLSSGGARGLAQIGVIEELERLNFEITSIAGSSMGAVIGGLYAMGKLTDYKEWVRKLDKLDVFKLIDFTFSTQGLIKGDKVFEEMKQFIADEQIENLRIPFAAIATDILNENEIVFTSGSVYDALRASVSIPSVLTPVERNGAVLIDGGVLNPLPTNRVKRKPGDLMIAVNLYAVGKAPVITPKTQKQKEAKKLYEKNMARFRERLKQNTPKTNQQHFNYLKLIDKTTDAMLRKIVQFNLSIAPPDILINVPQSAGGTFDFYKADELIEMGKRIGANSIEEYDRKMIEKYKNQL